MGSNIYPEDIEAVLYRDPLVAPRLHSFMLAVVDDETGTPRPSVAVELTDLDGVDDAWRLAAAERLRDGLERPQHRLPLVARRVSRGDAADRVDVGRRRRPVRRRRDADQAAPDQLRARTRPSPCRTGLREAPP